MQIGAILRNRYKIIKLLGSGGFGETYLGEDLDIPTDPKPKCVVKHLRPQSNSSSVVQIAQNLFNREAEVLYRLGKLHNQIPELYAHFEEGQQFYLVQQFIDGDDLSKELSPGKRWDEDNVKQLLEDILTILAFVHEQNIIHRDIKPANLMRRNDDGEIVLIDFGAVKQTMVLNTQGQTNLTVTIGTAGYMPSEQAAGKPKLCSDIYAVGMLGIYALTGIQPHELPKDPNTEEVIWRNWASVSDKFANVLDKMVLYHFSQRYQNAAEALQALSQVQIQTQPQYLLLNQPIQPTQYPSQYQQVQPNQVIPRRQVLKTLGWVCAGVGLSFVAGNLLQGNPSQQQQTTSNIPKEQGLGYDAETLYNAGLAKHKNKDYQAAIEDYSQVIKINPNYADAYYNRGKVRYELKDYQAAIEDYRQAIKINPNYAHAYGNLGIIRYELKDYQAAIEDYNQAIQINPNYEDAYRNRGLVHSELDDYQAAIVDYNQAIQINPNYGDTYTYRGFVHSQLRDYQSAIEDYRKAANLYKEQGEESKYQDALKQIKALQ